MVGAQIQIEHKDGRKRIVPLSMWENGLKLDTDWHVFVPPKHPVQPISPVTVLITPPAPPVVTEIKHRKKKGK